MSKKMQILKHLDKCKLQRVSPNIKPNKKNWKNSHMEIEIRKAESRKKKKKKKSIPVARRLQDKNSDTGEKAIMAVQDFGSTVYRLPLSKLAFYFPPN